MPMDLYQQEINDLCMPLKPEFEEYRLPPHSETTEYKTKNITKKYEKKLFKWSKNLTNNQPEKLKIMNIGVPQGCHLNCRLIVSNYPDRFRIATGYNLFMCPCGNECFGEVHSVLYDLKYNKYLDITEDMFDETEKYFVELDNFTGNYIPFLRITKNRDFDTIASKKKRCSSCGIVDKFSVWTDLNKIKNLFK